MRICHLCLGYMTQIANNPLIIGCSCGVRRMEKEIITLEDWVTSSGKYKERASSKELTNEVKTNAIILINKINQLLKELGVEDVSVSSGFRPSNINSAIPNAAKKSLHMAGKAIDIVDKNGKLDELLNSDLGQDLLQKYGVWQEHPDKTPNWTHCDIGDRIVKDRPGCKKRQFLP